MIKTKKSSQTTRWWLAALGVLAVFASLSLAIGLNQSVWYDEAYSVNLAKRPVGDLIHLTAVDVHPPVYYLLLKGWGSLFGFNDLGLRSLSVVLMTSVVLVMMLWMRQMFDQRTALITGALLSVSPLLLRYGFEIRMYAMAVLIMVVASWLLWLILQRQSKGKAPLSWWAGYAALVALGEYTLYFSVLIWLAHLAYLIYWSIQQKRKWWREPFWLAYAGAVVLFSPWLLTAIKQMFGGALANVTTFLTLPNLLGIVSFNFFYQPIDKLSQIQGALLIWLIVATVILIRLFWRQTKSKTNHNLRQNWLFLAALAVLPVIWLWLICLAKPMYLERYLVFVSPFLLASLAVLLARLSKPKLWYWLAPTALILFGTLHLAEVGNFNFQMWRRPNPNLGIEIIQQQHTKYPLVAAGAFEGVELSYAFDQFYFIAKDDISSGGYAALNGVAKQIKQADQLPPDNCLTLTGYTTERAAELLTDYRQIHQTTLEHWKIETWCKN